MTRILCLFALLAIGGASSLSTAHAQVARVEMISKGIKPGEAFEGEFGEKHKLTGSWRWQDERFGVHLGDNDLYQGAIPLTLRAGQELTITASVLGDDRFVGIRILDPSGKRIKESDKAEALGQELAEPRGVTQVNPKSIELTIKQVGASGKYTVIVVSNRVGAFTVRAAGDAGEDDRAALEKELRDLKTRAGIIEAKLKALDEASKKK